MPTFVVINLWQLPVSENMFAYLLSFQSLTIVALVAAAIALLHVYPSRCFLLLLGGAASHFVLDILETDVDCGMRVFYPFSFSSWSPGWLATGSRLSTVVLIIAAMALAWALKQHGQLTKVVFQAKRNRLCCAGVLIAVAFVFPLVTRQMFVDHNVHSLAFFRNPEAWQNRSVELCFSEVISTSPLAIQEFDKRFELMTTKELAVGQYVSVRGVYGDGKIYPTRLYTHAGFSEAWFSLGGLIVLLAMWSGTSCIGDVRDV
jgi:hypothetical protein